MLTVSDVKTDLRITHDRLDQDIEATIAAAKLDLGLTGIRTEKEDALLEKAIKIYCRWQYDFCGKGEQYARAYAALRDAMSLCGDYNGGGI